MMIASIATNKMTSILYDAGCKLLRIEDICKFRTFDLSPLSILNREVRLEQRCTYIVGSNCELDKGSSLYHEIPYIMRVR